MVAEWKLPSSVTAHLTAPGSNVRLDQVALKFLLLRLSLFAEAVPTASENTSMAVNPANRSLLRVRI
jgi:hypothetical protein